MKKIGSYLKPREIKERWRKKRIANKTYRKLKQPRQPIHAKVSYEDSVINYVKRREQNAKYERGEL